ncbi:hypothetical protein DFH11DRAFT_1583984 [Phellopilus nigrolimitatus]|nr:hypothetical protein DFH11DRAFT_1583984 [Phellopilus nigrolimitatus]
MISSLYLPLDLQTIYIKTYGMNSMPGNITTAHRIFLYFLPVRGRIFLQKISCFRLWTRMMDVYNKTFLAPHLIPCPTYEACTPATISIGPRRFQIPSDESLPFFPYIDDENLDSAGLASIYPKFLWMVESRDPDVEQIQLETLRRLIAIPGTTFSMIDNLKSVLPKLHETDQSGLLWVNAQRDPLLWGGETLKEQMEDRLTKMYPQAYRFSKTNESGRLDLNIQVLCSNLNCIDSHCRTHSDPTLYKPVRFTPEMTSSQLYSDVTQPCGEKCFKTNIVEDPDDVIWDNDTLYNLRNILTVCPDVVPCKLVHAFRMPCYEIFVQRQKLILDADVAAPGPLLAESPETPSKERIIEGKETFSSLPCQHLGPCGEQTKCICWENGLYCQRSCHCDLSCVQRWKGCRCRATSSKGACKPYFIGSRVVSCPCVRADRECDPELCKSCSGRFRPTCRNMSIQHGRGKRIKIAPSLYGFGAFLVEGVRKFDLVGEYVGEMVPKEEKQEVREFHNNYRHRNYAFTLVDGDSVNYYLDALGISNETRFPNHDSDGRGNCYARTLLVNGQYRIALFALKDIRAGKEVLFDYGDGFFGNENNKGSG